MPSAPPSRASAAAVDRIGLDAPPRLAERGHVIDVHDQPSLAHFAASPIALRSTSQSSSASAPMRASSSPSIITRASGSVPE